MLWGVLAVAAAGGGAALLLWPDSGDRAPNVAGADAASESPSEEPLEAVGAQPGSEQADPISSAPPRDASVSDEAWEEERRRAIAEGRPFPAKIQLPPPPDLPEGATVEPPAAPEEMSPEEEIGRREGSLELLTETRDRLQSDLTAARSEGDDDAIHRLEVRIQRLERLRERRERELAELRAERDEGP